MDDRSMYLCGESWVNPLLGESPPVRSRNEISSISFEIDSATAPLEIYILLNMCVTVLHQMEMTNRNNHLLYPQQHNLLVGFFFAENSAAMLFSLQQAHRYPYPESMGGYVTPNSRESKEHIQYLKRNS